MSPNRHRPHVLVLPEDDANRELANGFHLQVDMARQRQMQVLPVAGGWMELLNRFKSEHVRAMDRCPSRFMVLLIDFDGRKNRLQSAKAAIPVQLADRVFVLGAWSNPEALRGDLGAYEQIGLAMADDCREETDTTWGHKLLRHNAGELGRLREHVRSILF
jgi:hypothetical protein